MPTFTWVPSYGAKVKSKPVTHKVQFGDGYAQRAGVGINNNPQVWSLTFDVAAAVADEIDEFLKARGGHEPFDWTPPRSEEELRWVCEEWDKAEQGYDQVVITATFVQDFSP